MSRIPTRSKTLRETSTCENIEENKKNFWEPGNYSYALKRVEYSSKLITELENMFTEYATIEAKFGKQICEWSSKWHKYLSAMNDTVDKDSFLYGSNKDSLFNFILSSQEQGKSHIDNWSRVHSDCIQKFREFQEKNIHKNFNYIREIKDLKEDFITSQTPYIETYEKLKNANAKYSAYLNANKINIGINNVIEQSTLNLDEKKTKKLDKHKKTYDERKKQLHLLIPHYTEKMNDIFLKCDNIERDKLNCIKSAMVAFNVISSFTDSSIRTKFLNSQVNSIKEINIDEDILWWYNKYGPGCKYDFESIAQILPSKKPTLFGLKIGKDPQLRLSTQTDESHDTEPYTGKSKSEDAKEEYA